MKKIALLVALVLGLAACSGLPRSGEVNVVPNVQATAGDVVLDAQGPVKGADPQEVVEAFIRASAAGLSDNFQVARQYLTDAANAEWDPTAQVRIYPDNQNQAASVAPNGAIRISVGALAQLDANGRYSTASADSVISSEFSLVRNGEGEWRIAVLDDGVIMSNTLFRSLYATSSLYFLTADASALTPDVRWYPKSILVTATARGLLAGPSSYLSGATTTAIPAGTALTATSVEVNNGTARIELSAEVASLDAQRLAQVKAQFQASMLSTGQVQLVELSVAGSDLPVPSSLDLTAYPYATYSLAVLKDGVPGTYRDGQVQPMFSALNGLRLTDLARNYDENQISMAALSDDGTQLYLITRTSLSQMPVLDGKMLIHPSIDRYGLVWTGALESDGQLIVVDPVTRARHTVAAPWMAGANVRRVAISREGARAAIVLEKDGQVTIYVAGIERDATTDIPRAVSEPMRVGNRLTDVLDIAWTGESRLAAIAKTATGSERGLYIVTIGGLMGSMNTVQGATSLTAGRGEESIILTTDDGTLYEYDSGAWRVLDTSVSEPALPG